MEIEFFGAAQTVTGSQHLLRFGNSQVMLDCGLFQGPREESFTKNRTFVTSPNDVSAVILSHAHTDHAGNLPSLVRHGYKGKIFTTTASMDMANFMLRDSGRIQENDVEFVNKKRAKKGLPPMEALYTEADAEATLPHFLGVSYHQPFQPVPNMKVTFFDAGHILGSAFLVAEIEEDGKTYRIGFSGDLGRKDKPILRDPEAIGGALDAMIMESTYGNSDHKDPSFAVSKLAEVVRQTSARNGKLIIPSFAVGRAQDLVYWLHRLMNSGDIPRIPIYVDSPLTNNISQVYSRHRNVFDEETLDFIGANPQGPLKFKELNYIQTADQSKALNAQPGPMVIISASGMCETGRILHHLSNNIGDERNTVLIVSWQAPYTLGRRLLEKQPFVNIFGEKHRVRASVEHINGLSAHADQREMRAWLKPLIGQCGHLFLVHGEPDVQEYFAANLRDDGFANVTIPQKGDRFTL
ncbi:MAG TPA: MBL fold metallo-hydrolase [Anaerolineales bacterium]|nr:MBL fold metallo-hydrolase [Anaerolineales bacterium]